MLYSRDIISAAMRSFTNVLEEIRGLLFHPDKTRSGMLTPVPCAPGAQPLTPVFQGAQSNVSAPGHVVSAGGVTEPASSPGEGYSPGTPVDDTQVKMEPEWPAVDLDDEIIDVDAPKLISRPWNSDSEEESSSDDSSSSEEEQNEGAASSDRGEQFVPPLAVKWFINAKTLVIHERRDAGTFRCGRSLGPTYFAVPALNGLRCGKCFARDL